MLPMQRNAASLLSTQVWKEARESTTSLLISRCEKEVVPTASLLSTQVWKEVVHKCQKSAQQICPQLSTNTKLAVQNLPWAVQLALNVRYLQIWSLPTVLDCNLAVQNNQQIWYKNSQNCPQKCSKISKSKPPLALIPCRFSWGPMRLPPKVCPWP